MAIPRRRDSLHDHVLLPVRSRSEDFRHGDGGGVITCQVHLVTDPLWPVHGVQQVVPA